MPSSFHCARRSSGNGVVWAGQDLLEPQGDSRADHLMTARVLAHLGLVWCSPVSSPGSRSSWQSSSRCACSASVQIIPGTIRSRAAPASFRCSSWIPGWTGRVSIAQPQLGEKPAAGHRAAAGVPGQKAPDTFRIFVVGGSSATFLWSRIRCHCNMHSSVIRLAGRPGQSGTPAQNSPKTTEQRRTIVLRISVRFVVSCQNTHHE